MSMTTDHIRQEFAAHAGDDLKSFSPIDGSELFSLQLNSLQDTSNAIANAREAFAKWQTYPAPIRGELIRLFSIQLREHKERLASLITLENGKILTESLGEVQEMIDICDFAVGLSRQLYGLTIASERYQHKMQENWLPLGVVGVISAFNFPVAVWAWNIALALVCGNAVIWKPSEKTPLVSLYCHKLLEETYQLFEEQTGYIIPKGLSHLLIGYSDLGEELVQNPSVTMVSATGSTRMGKLVAPELSRRFARSLLELGGNNAVIVTENASLDVALPSIVFGAVGTAGQRCTTTRRAFIHHSIYEQTFDSIYQAYKQIIASKIGNPMDHNTLLGPLIDQTSFDAMQRAMLQAEQEGGEVHFGNRLYEDISGNAYYVEPALVKIKQQTPIVQQETFAPLLYVMPYNTLEEALSLQNDVPQGLSSAIFTTDLREAEYFKTYSDCGIANVNIGTSGAEIGGAFGGEKETGGGRESGSDAWKNYMRRQTSTTYYGQEAPALAQGVKFNL